MRTALLLGSGLLIAACGSGDDFAPENGSDSESDTDTDTDVGADAGADAGADTDTDSDTDCTYPEVVSDCDGDWCTILPGCFVMGTPEDELGRDGDETQHQVTVSTKFEMGMYEVTENDFIATTGWWPSSFFMETCTGDCPLTYVSWFDALAYANLLSEFDGLTPCYSITVVTCEDDTSVDEDAAACMNEVQGGIDSATVELNGVGSPNECEGYRLPTESEWEYAIRAGSATAFYKSDGNDGTITELLHDPNMDVIGWYYYNAEFATHAVGGKAANAWGLYDMSGDLWEWVWDWYGAYPQAPTTDPTGPESALERVARGGYWASYAQLCRSGNRVSFNPGNRTEVTGFRLARSVP